MLHVHSPGTLAFAAILFVCAVIWYCAQGSIRGLLSRAPPASPGRAGLVVVFLGWAVLIVLGIAALANLADCSMRL